MKPLLIGKNFPLKYFIVYCLFECLVTFRTNSFTDILFASWIISQQPHNRQLFLDTFTLWRHNEHDSMKTRHFNKMTLQLASRWCGQFQQNICCNPLSQDTSWWQQERANTTKIFSSLCSLNSTTAASFYPHSNFFWLPSCIDAMAM